MGAPAWEVVFVDLGEDEDAFDELAEDLTDRQVVRVQKQFDRLRQHGPGLDGDYFDNVEGSRRGLKEFRLTADGVAVRFLYVLRERTFVMLKGFRHSKRRDLDRHTPTAEARLDKWEGQK
jgi:hypothetical protein